MTIGHDLEHRLDSWMQEDATLPDDLREVLAKLPETPQRRHRWSLGLADLTWRTRTMFSATRIAALVAILTLGGGLAIYSGALGPTADQAAVPSAEITAAEDPTQMPIRFEQSVGANLEQQGVTSERDGVSQLRGQITNYVAESADDPRLVGTGRFILDAADHGGFGPEWGTFRLENEEGAWQGTMSGFHAPLETRLSGWLVGEGAYEGQTQYREMVADHGAFTAVIKGIIYPGDPPQDIPVFE